MTDAPFVVVIAGPNGSGKTTLTRSLLDAGVDFGIHIDPDEITRTLDMPEPQRSAQAQRIADFKRDICLQRRDSFSFETVMSHPSKIELMVRAHDAGYDITVYFVATADPEINVRRVENRVSLGGHDVPHDRIRKRYWRSLGYLAHAALVARRSVAFDNSALVGPSTRRFADASGLRPAAEVTGDGKYYEIRLEAEAPAWVHRFLVRPLVAVADASEGRVTVMVHPAEGPLA